MPKGQAELVTGLHETKKRVPTVTTEIGSCAAADFAFSGVTSDVVLRDIGVQWDLWPIQDHKQFLLLGMEALEEAVQGDKAGASAEQIVEASAQLRLALWHRLAAVALEIGVEPPDALLDAVDGLALLVGEGVELVHQPLGMDPA